MKKIAKSKLSELFSFISGDSDLFLPIKKAGQVNFELWDEEKEVSLETVKTVKSGKDIFFPQSENLYTCHRNKNKLSIVPEELCDKEFVVFGMKACDVRGIEVLDKVFLLEPVDTFYLSRRRKGTILSLACFTPDESCFCKAFDIDCLEPGADVSMWLINELLYLKENTEKGKKFIEKISGLLEDADESEINNKKEEALKVIKKLPLMNLSLEGWDGTVLDEKFNSGLWEELYKPCLTCGTCTFVCPTCQCYDIKDYDTGNGIKRYRCWDSCMYSDFTMMAHGNNRTSQMQRFRQRFMHKLVYFPANNEGMYSCVGCGRCVEKCPSSLNIVKVIKAFQKQGGKN